MTSFFPRWLDGERTAADQANAFGGSADGILREQVVLPKESWMRAPAGWSFEQAASLPCADLTTWQALFEGAPMAPGDAVLLQSAWEHLASGQQLGKVVIRVG